MSQNLQKYKHRHKNNDSQTGNLALVPKNKNKCLERDALTPSPYIKAKHR